MFIEMQSPTLTDWNVIQAFAARSRPAEIYRIPPGDYKKYGIVTDPPPPPGPVCDCNGDSNAALGVGRLRDCAAPGIDAVYVTEEGIRAWWTTGYELLAHGPDGPLPAVWVSFNVPLPGDSGETRRFEGWACATGTTYTDSHDAKYVWASKLNPTVVVDGITLNGLLANPILAPTEAPTPTPIVIIITATPEATLTTQTTVPTAESTPRPKRKLTGGDAIVYGGIVLAGIGVILIIPLLNRGGADALAEVAHKVSRAAALREENRSLRAKQRNYNVRRDR